MPRWIAPVALAVALALAAGCGAGGEPARFAAEWRLFANGRLAVIGEAPLPDGAWVYVEAIADPGRLNAPWAEAVPVAGRRFVAVTPFGKPLAYRAVVVLSPQLNPSLREQLDAFPEHVGVEIRDTDAGRELALRIKTAIGGPHERAETHRAIVAEGRRRLGELDRDLAAFDGAGFSADPAATYRRFDLHRLHVRERAPAALLYAPSVATQLEKTAEALDALFRARTAGSKDEAARQEAADAAHRRVESARALLDRLEAAAEEEN